MIKNNGSAKARAKQAPNMSGRRTPIFAIWKRPREAIDPIPASHCFFLSCTRICRQGHRKTNHRRMNGPCDGSQGMRNRAGIAPPPERQRPFSRCRHLAAIGTTRGGTTKASKHFFEREAWLRLNHAKLLLTRPTRYCARLPEVRRESRKSEVVSFESRDMQS